MPRDPIDLYRFFFQYSFPQNCGIRVFKRQVSSEHFVGKNSQRILVCRSSLRSSSPLFRSHVGAGAGSPVVCHGNSGQGCVDLSCQTKIQNFDRAVRRNHDISRLDIPVYHSFGMGIIQSFRDLPDDRQNLFLL